MSILVEACVTSLEEAMTCADAGADRLELCRDLDVDGVTPDMGDARSVIDAVPIPTFVMVRSRPGDFVYSSTEVGLMVESVREAVDAGAAGIVIGALTPDLDVDGPAVQALVAAAGDLPVTFHRAFDQVTNRLRGLEALMSAGVARVLTGGGPGRALDQSAALRDLVGASGGKVQILAAGGVRGDHVTELIERTGVSEVHARAEGIPGILAALGH